MRTILIPVEPSAFLPSVMTCALRMARDLGGVIEGLYVRPALPRMVPAGGAGAMTPRLVEGLAEEDRLRRREARAAFERFMTEQGVPVVSAGVAEPRPCARWQEVLSTEEDAVGSRGRLFDLIVVGRPVRGEATPSMATLEAVLFESGRPVLIAPPEARETIGRRVVIAWNGSTESARAVAFAMPLIVRAERVFVLRVESALVSGPSARELARNLAVNDVPAEPRERASQGLNAGEMILAECAALGADLLIKGAYTHSRLRQMIFGGATSHILAAAELPVLMAH